MERASRVPINPAQYHPKDAIGMALKGGAITTMAGLTLSAVQNSLTKQNVGAWGVFTRTGGVIAIFAAMGSAFEFTKAASANLREKDDSWNPAIGGFVGGAILGLRLRTIPAVLGYGASAALLLGVFDYTGSSFGGYAVDRDVDHVERKEQLRRNRRRPIQETVDELGEGRGVYAPGYQERRRERLKQHYGIDIRDPPPPRPVES
ncbi:MAG: hypothetical protein M1823_003933 [Watsoniomyces obsoletus]|nr:MAG: hypothetical protein M1823_003933 [Watsoniomyces obsoletus]